MGNCVIDSVTMEHYGKFDHDYVERKKLHEYLLNVSAEFKRRWKLQLEIYNHQDNFCLQQHEWSREWEIIVSLASTEFISGTKMLHGVESAHIFALANIYKRPIIVIADNKHFVNGVTRFGGIYLPILNKSVECEKSPIIIAYNQSHCTAMFASNGSKDMIYPIVDREKELMAMPYSTVTNKKPLSTNQKIKLLKHYLNVTYTNEHGQAFLCVKHASPIVNIAEKKQPGIKKMFDISFKYLPQNTSISPYLTFH